MCMRVCGCVCVMCERVCVRDASVNVYVRVRACVVCARARVCVYGVRCVGVKMSDCLFGGL